MKTYGIDRLGAALYDLVHDYRDPQSGQCGAPALGTRINVNPGTLGNKASPQMTGHHFNVHELRAAMLVATDFRALYALANDCHHACVPLSNEKFVADQHLLDALLKITREEGDVALAIQRALADGEITADEFRGIESEIDDVLRAILELRDRVGSLVVDKDTR